MTYERYSCLVSEIYKNLNSAIMYTAREIKLYFKSNHFCGGGSRVLVAVNGGLGRSVNDMP